MELKYNNKTYKIPKGFAKNIDTDQALDIRTCQNPYSGETCELPDFAATIYYNIKDAEWTCLLYTSPSPRDRTRTRMPSSA